MGLAHLSKPHNVPWFTFYLALTLAPCQQNHFVGFNKLVVPDYFESYNNLGFERFQGNKPASPLTWNLITNIKQADYTFIDYTISINEKNKFEGNLKILYISVHNL